MTDYQGVLDHIAEAVQPHFGKGKVADYIPALASVPARKFGMAVRTTEGDLFVTGDAAERFSIQSISKLFMLELALQHFGDMVWTRVGKEPSGDRFNSMMRLEHEAGIPRNPFINPGALAITDLMMSLKGDTKFRIRNYLRFLAMTDTVDSNADVAASELAHAHVNRALANLMKGYGNIHGAVDALMATYCYQCAMEMNCAELATAALPLAGGGYSALHDAAVISASQAKRIGAVMLTCGMYDSVGSFAYRVGLPAKSGVGGGIVAIVPGKMAISVWAPELDAFGNSYVGTHALELFTNLTHTSIF
ncbi:glutaminase [Kordiimonas marina]|uniref:glutaminase n=1 Tax=Kordiimonas marina TaxID=2872312 RepID=UPI001FF616D7|nr:glutaminase [Kordiimonas marina]